MKGIKISINNFSNTDASLILLETQYHKLTQDNFKKVLSATSCIPGITEPVDNIPGCIDGFYIDAAVSDYNLGFRINDGYNGLVLNQFRKLHRTYFDKFAFRTYPVELLDNASVMYPTEHFTNHVDLKRLPHLNEWFERDFVDDPSKRIAYWTNVHELSKQYFMEDLGGHLP